MYMSEIVCMYCQKDAMEAAKRGSYLKRANKPEELPAEWVCAGGCNTVLGKPEEAIVRALEGKP